MPASGPVAVMPEMVTARPVPTSVWAKFAVVAAIVPRLSPETLVSLDGVTVAAVVPSYARLLVDHVTARDRWVIEPVIVGWESE